MKHESMKQLHDIYVMYNQVWLGCFTPHSQSIPVYVARVIICHERVPTLVVAA